MKGYYYFSRIHGEWCCISQQCFEELLLRAEADPVMYDGLQLLHIE